jgi:hypothetical protein
MAKKDLSGKIYSRWTIVSPNMVEGKTDGWLCRCNCGTEKIVNNISTVISGKSTSCGCFRREHLKNNNPMFCAETAAKVSELIKADPNRAQIIHKAAIAAQTNEVKDKRRATNMERYGGAAPASSRLVKSKIAATNYARYGGISPVSSDLVKSKIVNTTFSRYGVDNIMKLQSMAKTVGDKISATRRAKGTEKTSNGLCVVDECRSLGVLPTTYRNWRRLAGQEYAESKLYADKVQWRSALEKRTLDLFEPLSSLDVKIESWNKKVLESETLPYKPDIRLSLGASVVYVDVDGLYWHSDRGEDDQERRSYHADKAAAFAQEGVRLIQFRENEIRDKSEIVLSIVKHSLNISSRRVGARELNLCPVNDNSARDFLSNNHIMGHVQGATHHGLYLDTELLAIMSTKFIKKNKALDIARFAVKKDTSVAGAFLKLLNNAKRLRTDADMVINFVDLRIHTGASSVVNGFTLESVHLGFEWTDGKNVFNRRHCVADAEHNISELQKSQDMGLYKLWNAGQARYELKLK